MELPSLAASRPAPDAAEPLAEVYALLRRIAGRREPAEPQSPTQEETTGGEPVVSGEG